MGRPPVAIAQRIKLGVALALLSSAIASSAVAAQPEAVGFDLEVLPAASRYVELASYPAYLLVALQNNGISPSAAGRVVVEDARTLRFKFTELSFVRAANGVFHYKATVGWPVGIVQTKFELPVEADLSKVGEGKVAIRVYPPLAQLFPDELTDKIRLKVQGIATPAAQQRMLAYFDGLPGSKETRMDTARMFERILIDAYNQSALAPGLAGAREPGDAEPLADQWMLLTTLAIWLVIVPGFFAARAVWKRRKR